MLEDAAAKGDTRPFRLLYAARNAGALVALGRLRDLQARLDLNVTCCLDQRCDVPGIDAGPLTRQKIADLPSGIAPEEVTALICGPAGLMEMAADHLLAFGVPARQIHYERFDYAAGRSRLDRKRARRAVRAVVAVCLSLGLQPALTLHGLPIPTR
jgi:ferredoxin-NADP reductase